MLALPGIVANNTTFCYSYKCDKISCKSYWSIQFISSSNAVYKCRKMHYNFTFTRNKNFVFSVNVVINEFCYISFVCLMTAPLPLSKSKLLCSPLKGVANFCLFSTKAVICTNLTVDIINYSASKPAEKVLICISHEFFFFS